MIARAPVSGSLNLILSSRLGLVSVPQAGPASGLADGEAAFDRDGARELLGALGGNLGMTLLAPREDAFPETGAAAEAAPAFPDAAVGKALEGLDVVWMHGGEPVAAFVMETGTGWWEGLRRLADLLALHPKLKAALYVVSLPGLKAGLLAEINRPVYRLLKRPLGETVRILDWKRLQSEVNELGDRVRYLKAEFLEGISEVVEPPAER
ncbi:MAG TPA: hypothetical protein VJ385_04515 [Fibrobacteria bacterium]|nr:hypothetical protein [Fibrobacteria bacterium]